MDQRVKQVGITLVLVSIFLFFSSYHLMLTAFPLYISSLGGSEQIVGLLVGIYFFSAVGMRFYFGKLADTRGRKVVLLLSILASIAGPILYLPNLGFWYLAFVRVLHAVGLAAFMTASHTLLADFSTPENRGRVFGLFGVASGVPMMYGPSLGLRIAGEYGYPILFLVISLVSMAMLACYLRVKEPHQEASLSAVPAIPFSELLKNRWVVVSSLGLLSVTMVMGALSSFLPLHGISVGITDVGVFFTAFSLTFMLSGVVSGPLSDKYGRKTIATPAFLLVITGLALLTQLTDHIGLVVSGLIGGFGYGTVNTVLLALVVDRTSNNQRAQAVSFFNNNYDLGVSLGAMGLGAVAAYSYQVLWGVLSLCVLAGFMLVICALPSMTTKKHLAG